MYNAWKDKCIPALGQFSFNMSDLVCNLYNAHNELYAQLYEWIKAEHNSEIMEFHQANYELVNLAYLHEGYSSVDQNVNFDLN